MRSETKRPRQGRGEVGLIRAQLRGRLLRTGPKDTEQRDAEGDLVSSLINGHSNHDWEITTCWPGVTAFHD